MPDTLTPTQPNIPEGATPEEVFAAFQPAETSTPQQAPSTEPEQPAQKPAEKAPDTKVQDIPEQFLTGKKPEQAQEPDEYEEMMGKEPSGQLKHEDWKRLKAAMGKKVDALTAQLREREEKLQAAEKRGVPEEVAKKLEQYEKTLAEREAVLERIAVQESPKFKSQFTSKEAAISDRLKRSGTELGLDVDALDMALKSSPKRRAEILDQMEMGETARSSLAGLMNQFDLLQDDKAEFLNQSREVHAKWKQEEQEAAAAQERQRSEYEKSVFTNIGKEIRETYAPFQRVEGNPAWNAQAEGMEAEAEKYFNGQLPLEDLARVVYKGVGAPVTEKILQKVMEENRTLKETLESFKRSQPGSNGSLPHQSGAPDDSHLTLEQRRMQTFNRFVGGQ